MRDFIGMLCLFLFGLMIGVIEGVDYKEREIAESKTFIYDQSRYQCNMINTLKENE